MTKKRTVFKNGWISREKNLQKNAVVIVEGDKISGIKNKESYKWHKSDHVIDAKGKIIAPGFIDVHIHGAGNVNALDGKRSTIQTMSRKLAQAGVTSYLAAVHYFDQKPNDHLTNIARYSKEDLGGAKLLGMHLEGPFINQKKRGMIRTNNIIRPTKSRMEEITRLTGNKMRIMTIAPEIKGSLRAIRYFQSKGVTVSLGHTDATSEEARKGFDAGITHITHMFNTMRSFSHRDPGPLGALPEKKNVFVELIADGVHVKPEAILVLLRLVGPKRICLISDSINAGARGGRTYFYNQFPYRVSSGAAWHSDGKLIGTVQTLTELARRMKKFTNLSLCEIINMCSINPAKSIRYEQRTGSIVSGKEADIILIDNDFKVFLTMISGKIVYKRKIGPSTINRRYV